MTTGSERVPWSARKRRRTSNPSTFGSFRWSRMRSGMTVVSRPSYRPVPNRYSSASAAPDDPGDGREADPAPLELAGGMQPLERFEQLVAVRHVEPGPVVANVVRLRAVGHGAAELDARLRLAARVLQGVLQQVLERH